MRLWRIASGRYDPLDGEGARRAGGRWNSPGRPCVYASAQASLAVLEKLVWVDPEDVPNDLHLFEIDFPDDAALTTVEPGSLPSDWTEPGSPVCLEVGDRWLMAGGTAALVVPSVILPEERNVLINPLHSAAARIRLVDSRPFAFDVRLLQ
jgi:RES domain-containing protein